MKKNVEILERNECVGCKACGDICPQKAISFKDNLEGFWYPVIDAEKCNECSLCYDRCPVINSPEKLNEEKSAYASWIKDEKLRLESTSGGVYYAIAMTVLEMGGVLAGCAYTEDYCSAYHLCTDTVDGLRKLAGSKYFQSDTKGIYKEVRDLLNKGIIVLFVGSPCQVAAMKKFLDTEYENLITVDFICRGIPSPMVQRKKIGLYEKKMDSKVIYYRDKSKKEGWENFGELIKFENGKERFISRWRDRINDCYISKNLNIRESCYNCKFKMDSIVSDITVGDFWGIKGVTSKDLKYGVSALITNTAKGENLIKRSKSKLYLDRRPLSDVYKDNPAYIQSTFRPDENMRENFFSLINTEGLSKAVNEYVKKNWMPNRTNIKRRLKVKLSGVLPIIRVFNHINWIKFIKYNFFTKEIVRQKDAYLIPCKGSIIKVEKNAKIVLKGNALINYYNGYLRGNHTTLFNVMEGANLVVNNDIELAYENTFSISKNSYLETGHLFTGVGANIICNHRMMFGNRVMLGRDVCIYDSDYHEITNYDGDILNDNKEVIIGDNVWIGARAMVLKGAFIKDNAIISANSMVLGEVEGNRCFINKREMKSVGGNVLWKR